MTCSNSNAWSGVRVVPQVGKLRNSPVWWRLKLICRDRRSTARRGLWIFRTAPACPRDRFRLPSQWEVGQAAMRNQGISTGLAPSTAPGRFLPVFIYIHMQLPASGSAWKPVTLTLNRGNDATTQGRGWNTSAIRIAAVHGTRNRSQCVVRLTKQANRTQKSSGQRWTFGRKIPRRVEAWRRWGDAMGVDPWQTSHRNTLMYSSRL